MTLKAEWAVINAEGDDYLEPPGYTSGTIRHNGAGDYTYIFPSGFNTARYTWDSSVHLEANPGWTATETVVENPPSITVIVKYNSQPNDHAFRWDATPRS